MDENMGEKIKVLMTCHFPLTGSGSGVYTLNVAHALAKRGCEVHIIVPENEVVEDIGEICIHPVYFNGCTDGALDFNFPCFTTHPRSTQTFYDLSDSQLKAYEDAFRDAIAQEIESFNPDIIHCGHAWLQPSYALDFGIPVVITVHGTDIIGYERISQEDIPLATVFEKAVRKAMDGASGIITISKENDALVRRLFPEQSDKCALILNGYNPDVFYPEALNQKDVLEALGIDGPQSGFDHIVSFAGKFAHFKGIDVLLKGIAELQRDCTEHTQDTAFIVAGDGELYDEMDKLAENLGLEHVYLVHNQPHDMLRKIYSIADVSLLTSRKEPFGLVIIEAMACGAPVIASDDGGASDIVTPEVGLLFESENEQALAICLESVLDGEYEFDRDQVAKYASMNFSQDNSIGRLIEIYESIID